MAAKSKKKSKNRKNHRRSYIGILLVFLAMTIYLAVIWFYITQAYHDRPLQTGRLAVAETFAGEDYSKSLDLRITAKAVYPSGPITTVKDLGVSQNIDEQTVSFKVTTDRLTEFGLMYLPTGKAPAKGWPTLILCHGYYDPDQYQTTSGYLTDMTFYAQHGFAVIKPDFRGQGLSLNDGQPDGAYYSMDYNTDVMSLITAVGQTGYLDKNNLSLWGHSMGAYIALRAAVLSPQIKNLILVSGPVGTAQDMFTDYTAISDKDNPLALKLRDAELLKYGTPTTDPKFWDAASPLNYLKHIKASIEINVGTDDQVVPPKFSAELDTALTKDGIGHQYYIYEGGDHGLMAQRPLIWQRSLALLDGGTGGQ